MIDIKPLDRNFLGEQMKSLTFHLLNGPYYCPDAVRDYNPLVKTLKRLFEEKDAVFMALLNGQTLSGVFGLVNVCRGHQAQFISWIWDKPALTPGLIKKLRDFLIYCKDVYALKRIAAQTACEKHERILNLVGFKIEGRFRNAFRWNGELRPLVMMRIIGEL